jgi:hypothetical protein
VSGTDLVTNKARKNWEEPHSRMRVSSPASVSIFTRPRSRVHLEAITLAQLMERSDVVVAVVVVVAVDPTTRDAVFDITPGPLPPRSAGGLSEDSEQARSPSGDQSSDDRSMWA